EAVVSVRQPGDWHRSETSRRDRAGRNPSAGWQPARCKPRGHLRGVLRRRLVADDPGRCRRGPPTPFRCRGQPAGAGGGRRQAIHAPVRRYLKRFLRRRHSGVGHARDVHGPGGAVTVFDGTAPGTPGVFQFGEGVNPMAEMLVGIRLVRVAPLESDGSIPTTPAWHEITTPQQANISVVTRQGQELEIRGGDRLLAVITEEDTVTGMDVTFQDAAFDLQTLAIID